MSTTYVSGIALGNWDKTRSRADRKSLSSKRFIPKAGRVRLLPASLVSAWSCLLLALSAADPWLPSPERPPSHHWASACVFLCLKCASALFTYWRLLILASLGTHPRMLPSFLASAAGCFILLSQFLFIHLFAWDFDCLLLAVDPQFCEAQRG